MVTSLLMPARQELPRLRFRPIAWLFSDVSLGIICLLMISDFVFRGLALSFLPAKTDFTELYSSAWLWRHGQNFYDSALVTAASAHLTGTGVWIAPIYPPTTLIAIAPFTLLQWKWANLLWLGLLLAGLAATIALLLCIRGFKFCERGALPLITFVLAFDPIHQAFHLGNIALLVVPMVLAGVALAEQNHDVPAGVMLSFAMLLKPQLGAWSLLFYIVQRRRDILAGALIPLLSFAFPLLRLRALAGNLEHSYLSNLEYWFGAGRPYGFTEGALPFHVNTVQVVLFQVWHNARGVNLIAHAMLVAGLGIWSFALWRSRLQVSKPLAISSLTGLSFISLYHSVSDVAILTLLACWISEEGSEAWKRFTCFVLLIILLPGHSILMRITPHLNPALIEVWWWKLFVARYFVWTLLALNATLLGAMLASARPRMLELPSTKLCTPS